MASRPRVHRRSARTANRVVSVRVALADGPVEVVDQVLDAAPAREVPPGGDRLGLPRRRARRALGAIDLVELLAVAVNGMGVAFAIVPRVSCELNRGVGGSRRHAIASAGR